LGGEPEFGGSHGPDVAATDLARWCSSVRVARGDTGFTVAVIVGQRGRALSTEFSPARVHVSNPLDRLGVIPADTHPPEKGTAPCSA
jgi:hypothetical protein